MRLVIVGVIPLFSILWIAAGDRPARLASCCSDQPRSARALATLAPMAETVCSISDAKWGSEVVVLINFPRRNVHYKKGQCNGQFVSYRRWTSGRNPIDKRSRRAHFA